MAYRVEISPNKRAGCKASDCKDANVKIEKGEIRFGPWVPFEDRGSFAWKHWGCVTPKQLVNLREKLEGDLSLLDGFDELPQEWQEKISRALEQGHVDDADWKGDPEFNRPGHTGKAKRTPKKKGDDEAGEKDEPKSPTKAASKKRGRAPKTEEADEGGPPAPKRTKAKAKSAVKKEDDGEASGDDEEHEPPARKSRDRKAKSAAKVIEPESAEEEQPKKKRGRPKKAAAPKVEEVEEEAEPDEPAPAETAKPKGRQSGRKKKSTDGNA